ncbi:MAG: phosphoribosylamine--glycine ligase [Candidatus Nanoarchaeia archaeon]|nr:phosphoribosylamine--glycine ligase [Candidatus Nanoarchaeia archaeon]
MKNKVLIVGSGGREHALGWSISQDKDVDEVIYAKGNAGTSLDDKCRNIDIDGTKKENFSELSDFVKNEKIDMVVVGPEQPLAHGIVDYFHNRYYDNVFGPKKDASIIETSKAYSFSLMRELEIHQADSTVCPNKIVAIETIKQLNKKNGIVIKADGLTGGKGVYVCDNKDEALLRLEEHAEKYSGSIIIAERLYGEEFSVFGISDGKRVIPLKISVQDHKRLLDNDKGPNTGGMGAYCPAPVANVKVVNSVAEDMMAPIVRKMEYDKEYRGFLYAAVIMTKNFWIIKKPKILEYNCRFGDPEAQPVVMMLNSIYRPIKSALEGKTENIKFDLKKGAACCVVMASNGYPFEYEKGYPIGGLEEVAKMKDVKVFHAGTILNEKGQVITAGGRVLGVTSYSENGIKDAVGKAYDAVHVIDNATSKINGKKVFVYRNDIARKAIERLK